MTSQPSNLDWMTENNTQLSTTQIHRKLRKNYKIKASIKCPRIRWLQYSGTFYFLPNEIRRSHSFLQICGNFLQVTTNLLKVTADILVKVSQAC